MDEHAPLLRFDIPSLIVFLKQSDELGGLLGNGIIFSFDPCAVDNNIRVFYRNEPNALFFEI